VDQVEFFWKPVENADAFGVARNGFNTVKFTPVTTTALRVDVQPQPDRSGGILEWKTDAANTNATPYFANYSPFFLPVLAEAPDK
jgi:hypothetical protein